MKKEVYQSKHKVISLVEDKIEAEMSWAEQRGYALSSARIINVLRSLISEIYTLEDTMERKEDGRYNFKIKVKEG
jgi:hypothetical protein